VKPDTLYEKADCCGEAHRPPAWGRFYSRIVIVDAQINSRPEHRVANVARNLCSQKSSRSSFARSATAFRQSRKSSLGLHPPVGNTRLQVLSDFAFLRDLKSIRR
jgi:hypothetical protein